MKKNKLLFLLPIIILLAGFLVAYATTYIVVYDTDNDGTAEFSLDTDGNVIVAGDITVTSNVKLESYGAITATATLTMASPTICQVTKTSAATVVLPSTGTATGQIFIIKNTGGANTITIDPHGSELLDGSSSSITIVDADNDCVMLWNGGTSVGWLLIGGYIQ